MNWFITFTKFSIFYQHVLVFWDLISDCSEDFVYFIKLFQWDFPSGTGDVDYRPNGAIPNVNMITIQFTAVPNAECVEIFDLVIEACCEFGMYLSCIFIFDKRKLYFLKFWYVTYYRYVLYL